ncbi:hypothetical protein IFM89_000836 [Coptis chinensis]|uniref:Uncharacterized protein n=1 Tax=Coptis chinensis TaxID=261450 RepID=A0A835MBC2_9MAGN|nr:hypothetical protein IFM89_000836 [Coptis chinensis]
MEMHCKWKKGERHEPGLSQATAENGLTVERGPGAGVDAPEEEREGEWRRRRAEFVDIKCESVGKGVTIMSLCYEAATRNFKPWRAEDEVADEIVGKQNLGF